jgi:hypothetical protein
MALLAGSAGGGPADTLCATLRDVSPLGGMVPMYVLMSAFHLAPWLKLTAISYLVAVIPFTAAASPESLICRIDSTTPHSAHHARFRRLSVSRAAVPPARGSSARTSSDRLAAAPSVDVAFSSGMLA